MYSKNSLEQLRGKIDLVEVLSPYIQLKRAGAVYKALCPFHEEKSPSFMIKPGDSHYHCFGCGAHGDAIQFLMTHLRMSFSEAVESLAEKFHVPLETGEEKQEGIPKATLKEALLKASLLYHFYLLHTEEGHQALEYLYSRGLDLAFIRRFQIGLAPSQGLFSEAMKQHHISDEILREAGFFSQSGRLLFSGRIAIPIRDVLGSIIGFSARKYKPDAQGPKYINTPETPLFKKSKILFGLNDSRKKIAKEKKVLIVEGQIDALRLIAAGFDWTVAGQGTAFGEDQVRELVQIGVRQVILALDGDSAGQEAAVKIGHLFQKEGIDVRCAALPPGQDPDLILREEGPEAWGKILEKSVEYLQFLIRHFSQKIDVKTPAGKNELIQVLTQRIREWNHPLMVHETLRKLAQLTQTPEALIDIPELPGKSYLKKGPVVKTSIDADRILEADLLLWLLLMGQSDPSLIQIAEANLTPSHLRDPIARSLFERYLSLPGERDLLSLAIEPEHQQLLGEIFQKRVNREKAKEHLIDTVQRILDRAWFAEREAVRTKIASGTCSEEELLALAKQFDVLKKNRPLCKTTFPQGIAEKS